VCAVYSSSFDFDSVTVSVLRASVLLPKDFPFLSKIFSFLLVSWISPLKSVFVSFIWPAAGSVLLLSRESASVPPCRRRHRPEPFSACFVHQSLSWTRSWSRPRSYQLGHRQRPRVRSREPGIAASSASALLRVSPASSAPGMAVSGPSQAPSLLAVAFPLGHFSLLSPAPVRAGSRTRCLGGFLLRS
jgi:hypothetical protein